ncbi:TRAP transporter substrate-binding protein [Rhodovulum euryhalinum]|uniref:TRAP-type mannitol/chloroaromatic compound transport system substrate-binding protein n=1 Tax=Rhodovulum euryhalinum TaxID=35805 RepID=A0A4R2KJR2_9RHOB|nr:TRAP transporter substrate-binding protein [Rhodovulum euryhalinum]TCO74181.1 TRAP-type mannitol/chloroaromatic compound transport system substrate-binding protein [Rhodovulum euryhalinum]
MTCKALLGAAAIIAAGVQVQAETLDVASTFPKNMPFLGEGAEVLAKNIEIATGGEVTLRVHGAGDLVPALEVLTSVSSGAIPAGWDFIGYWGGTIPVASLAGAMPFGPSPDLFVGWMWEGGGLEIVQKAYDPLGVKLLPCHVTAPEPGGWFNKEINTVADLEGLKMRISGMGGKVLNKLGASTQLLPAGELYVALERGRIDATEFSLPVVDKSLGFAEIAKYYYFPGWHQPASWNSLIVNMDVWNGFGEEVQNQILTACKATVAWSMAAAPEPQGAVIEEFRAMGVETKRFPDEVLAALRAASKEVLEEEAAKDPLFAEAYASIQDYLSKAQDWTSLQTIPSE